MPGRADAERPERGEERDSRLDVVAEERPEVDRVERLVEVAEQPDVLREDPVVEVRGERLVAEQRERADDERVAAGDAQDDPADDVASALALAATGVVDGAPARVVDGRRRHRRPQECLAASASSPSSIGVQTPRRRPARTTEPVIASSSVGRPTAASRAAEGTRLAGRRLDDRPLAGGVELDAVRRRDGARLLERGLEPSPPGRVVTKLARRACRRRSSRRRARRAARPSPTARRARRPSTTTSIPGTRERRERRLERLAPELARRGGDRRPRRSAARRSPAPARTPRPRPMLPAATRDVACAEARCRGSLDVLEAVQQREHDRAVERRRDRSGRAPPRARRP